MAALLLPTAGVAMLLALYLIFMWVPTEATMGIIQKIFYFHVPAGIVAFWAAFIGGAASLLYLKTRDPRHDDLALAANESVVVFSAINILLGALWGKRVWGIWWTWDARLTSAFLLLLIYCAYLILRRSTPREQRAVVSAVVCLFGMADVPLVYLSNRLFRTQHPSPVLGGGDDSGLAPEMLATFIACNVAMFLLWWCILRARRRVATLERRLDALTRLQYD
jgi:heme exporter protein C